MLKFLRLVLFCTKHCTDALNVEGVGLTSPLKCAAPNANDLAFDFVFEFLPFPSVDLTSLSFLKLSLSKCVTF